MTQKEQIKKLNSQTRLMNRRNEDRVHMGYKGHVEARTEVIKMVCIHCHQKPKNSQEVLEISELGFHITCDHVMGDVQNQCRDSEMMFQNGGSK